MREKNLLLLVACHIHHHNLMIVTEWVNLRRTENIPNLLTTIIPLTLTAHLLPMQKLKTVRMEGKEMRKYHQSREGKSPRADGTHPMAMETTIKRLMATITLMVPKETSDSLEGFGLRTATCTVHPSQGKFADAGCNSNRNGLLSPDGNFVVKRSDILEGLFEKSFCSTKQVSPFLSSQKFLWLLAGSQTISFLLTVLQSSHLISSSNMKKKQITKKPQTRVHAFRCTDEVWSKLRE